PRVTTTAGPSEQASFRCDLRFSSCVFYTCDSTSGAECARAAPSVIASPRSASKDPTVNRTFLTALLKYALAFGLLGYVVWRYWMPGEPHGLEAVWNKHVVRGEPIHTGFLMLAIAVLV